jgi:hypothetical protein
MSNFLVVYKGGAAGATEEERNAAMAAWGAWFGELGSAVVDAGAPFGESKSVGGNGSAELTGYTVLTASDLDSAVGLTSNCPIFTSGGSLEVYEAMEM